MSENQRRNALATTGVGLAGVAAGSAARQKGLQRAHFEDTKTPIKRAHIGAERQLLRGARGRRTWLVGAGLQAAALPATAVGLHGTVNSFRKRENMVSTGLRGAADALEDRLSSQAEAPPHMTAQTMGTTAGVGLAGSGLAALALRKKKIGPLARSAALSTAGAVTGAASLPAQAKVLEHRTKGQYTITPSGVQRKKRSPKRPSHDATMVDTRSGQVIPAGVRKADDGARFTRTQRRAMVAGAGGLPIPVVGDAAQAAAAGRLAAPPYRKRTAAEVFTSNQAGNIVGAGAGSLGAAALASRSPSAAARMTQANARVDQAKEKINSVAPQQVRDQASAVRSKVRSTIPTGGTRAARISGSAPAKLLAAHKAPAALGALAGGVVGGQVAMHSAYTRAMNRDDRYRDANRLARRGTTKVAKADMTRKDKRDLARKKQKAAVLSVIAGGAGMGALGATGATGVARRLPKGTKAHQVASRIVPTADKVKTPLLAVSSGVGGYSSMNFAGMQRQEAKNLDPRIAKAMPRIRPVGIGRRAAGVSRGHLRRVRTPIGGMRTISVRGSTR